MIAQRKRHGGRGKLVAVGHTHLIVGRVGRDDDGRMVQEPRHLVIDLKTEVELAHSLENPTGTTNLGIVYLIPAQRNLFYSVLSPVCAALAGGNCVVLEVCPTIV